MAVAGLPLTMPESAARSDFQFHRAIPLGFALHCIDSFETFDGESGIIILNITLSTIYQFRVQRQNSIYRNRVTGTGSFSAGLSFIDMFSPKIKPNLFQLFETQIHYLQVQRVF